MLHCCNALLVLVLALSSCGCSDEPMVLESAGARLDLQLSGRLLAVTRAAGTPLLESTLLDAAGAAAPVAVRQADVDVRLRLGAFGFRDRSKEPWIGSAAATARYATPRGASAKLAFASGGDGAIDVHVLSPGVFEVRVAAPEGFNRTALSFICHPDDQFVGLGAQTPVTHRGHVVPMWAMEQGAGKADDVEHYSAYTPRGQTYDSYMPIPVLYNPRGYMMLVRGKRRVDFDLCASDGERFRVEAWDKRLEIVVVTGDSPLQMIERMTAITGRPRLPARWIFSPWIDAIRGQSSVLEIARLLRDNDVPASAIWTEDWAGGKDGGGGYHLTYQWSVDKTLYPDLKAMTDELHGLGYRFLGYFNTFMSKGTPEFDNAVANKLLVEDDKGEPKLFAAPPGLGDTGLLDLTKPAAQKWMGERMRAAIALGIDGWMADFAEWLPWDARLHDGRSGAAAHNDYPLMWQRFNRDIWRDARSDNDFVYFVRSGFTGTQSLAPVVWAGDQNTTFDQDDGLPTVPRLGLNLAISGVSYFGHDVAGYTSLYNDPPDKELYWRWTQLGAFSPVMRTHHGTTANGGYWYGDKSDPEALTHFAKYARAHMQLVPYLYGLAARSASRGWPMMRPMFVHYPGMGVSIGDQYMLGDALLVAPVLTRGVRARTVKLPAGIWYDYWSGKRYTGGGDVEIDAPLDTIPVLARAGAVIPLLPATVDTLAPGASAAGVNDHDAVNGAMIVRLYSGRDGHFELADGGRIALTSAGAPSGQLVVRVGDERVSNGCVGAAPALPCVHVDRERRVVEVRFLSSEAQIVRVTSDGRAAFTVRTQLSRDVPLTLRMQY